MTLAELMKEIQAIAPHAMFDEAADGEVVVYLGLAVPPDADWETGEAPVEPLAQ
jgi:hypothetical protein